MQRDSSPGFEALCSHDGPSSGLTLEEFAENIKTFLSLLLSVFKRAVILVYKENCKLKKKPVRKRTFN